MSIRKAVITAAGWGTRFLPVTKAQPKEMLPLFNKPVIQYSVEEAIASGIEQILIVTSMGKHSLEDYFDRSFNLEHILQKKGMTEVLAEVSSIGDSVKLFFVHQREQLGLGHAVLTTREFINEETFVLLLPDDIIINETPVTKQLIKAFDKKQGSVLAIEEVPEERVNDYGIIKPLQIDDRLYQVLSMVEKPNARHAPSRLGIVGRYVLTPEIFPALEQTQPGKDGEIQLTDGLRRLLKKQGIYGYRFKGTRYDCGNPLGLLKASIAVALQNPDIAAEISEFLNKPPIIDALKSNSGIARNRGK
jgi:UTP--glucose-1-phosphate uridylyltransferase